MQEPTRVISSNRATLIDLALVSNVNYVQECSVITPLANSDHNGIYLAIKHKKPTKSSVRRQVWKYSQADFSKASDLIDETDWEYLFHGKSVDEACMLHLARKVFVNHGTVYTKRSFAKEKKCSLGISKHQTHYT